MRILSVSGNYLIVDDKKFPLKNALLNEVTSEYHIYDQTHELPTAYIKKADFASWENSAGTDYTAETLLDFLETYTGITDVASLPSIPQYQLLSADYQILAEDSGKTFLLDAIGEAITLAAVTVVGKWKFLCQVETATTDWTITAPTAVIQGSVDVASTLIPAAAESLITLVVAKFLPGDWITLESDGTNFYIDGKIVTTAGCTLTAP